MYIKECKKNVWTNIWDGYIYYYILYTEHYVDVKNTEFILLYEIKILGRCLFSFTIYYTL